MRLIMDLLMFFGAHAAKVEDVAVSILKKKEEVALVLFIRYMEGEQKEVMDKGELELMVYLSRQLMQEGGGKFNLEEKAGGVKFIFGFVKVTD